MTDTVLSDVDVREIWNEWKCAHHPTLIRAVEAAVLAKVRAIRDKSYAEVQSESRLGYVTDADELAAWLRLYGNEGERK
jgi:hypothetical protein